jgi:hypothetical protein
MWYYIMNNKTVGPVSEQQLIALITSGKLSKDVPVWKQGMPGWLPASYSQLAANFSAASTGTPQQAAQAGAGSSLPVWQKPAATPQPVAANQPQAYPVSNPAIPPSSLAASKASQIHDIEQLFMWSWICLAGSIVTGGLSTIGYIVLSSMLIHRFWSMIQDGYACTTPGKAVGFRFIPYYSLYWEFTAIGKLPDEVNAYIQRHQLSIAPASDKNAKLHCWFLLGNIVPFIGSPFGLVALIFEVLTLKDIKDIAIQTIRQTS